MLTANMKMIAECADKLVQLGEKLFNETKMETIKAEREYCYFCPTGYEFRDENGNVIETKKIVLGKKKKEYPKTYEECCELLSLGEDSRLYTKGYKASLIQDFQKLLICRDAYWYCYAKENNMPFNWKPYWAMYSGPKHCIIYSDNEIKWQGKHFVTEAKILAFPTEEMRDAFYENFKELIEECKELL